MNSSSLRSRLALLLWAQAALLVAALVAGFFLGASHPLMLVWLVAGVALTAWGLRRLGEALGPLDGLLALVEKIGKGDFSPRITGMDDKDEIGRLAASARSALAEAQHLEQEARSVLHDLVATATSRSA